MFVSPDVIGMVIALFAFAVAVLGGVGGMIAHQSRGLDARFDQVGARFDQVDARIDRLDTRIDRVEGRMDRVESQLDHLAGEIVEVKIAVARLEGPQRRLQRL
ncbi:response regulator [Microbacterium sp. MYb72]|uniref:response regulator n=1 Tax=Microbacterium sp. MYb72 TaxID=1848693 RepID=UPI0011B091EA|nr:response regulator [Microbacterium sp. MYb72]